MTKEQIIQAVVVVIVAFWTYLVQPLVKAYGAKIRQTVVGKWAYQLVLVAEKSGVPGNEKFQQAVTSLFTRLTNNKWLKKYNFTEADVQGFIEEAYNLMVQNGVEKKNSVVKADLSKEAEQVVTSVANDAVKKVTDTASKEA